MTSLGEMERLRSEVNYYRDRVALLRSKLYRWGLGSSPGLQALERRLASAQHRLREAQDSQRP